MKPISLSANRFLYKAAAMPSGTAAMMLNADAQAAISSVTGSALPSSCRTDFLVRYDAPKSSRTALCSHDKYCCRIVLSNPVSSRYCAINSLFAERTTRRAYASAGSIAEIFANKNERKDTHTKTRIRYPAFLIILTFVSNAP